MKVTATRGYAPITIRVEIENQGDDELIESGLDYVLSLLTAQYRQDTDIFKMLESMAQQLADN
jgi:hypothetical protein